MPKDSCEYNFALTGNGPVSNRGCQAILHGTCEILRREFGNCHYVLASFAKDPPDQLPRNVEPLELNFERPRWSGAWWKYQVRKGLGLPERRTEVVKTLSPKLEGCDAMFSIGGDNYAIDYGYEIVERLVAMNRHAQSRGLPVIIWGASIGPFGGDRSFEHRIAEHLSQIDLIVLREPVSQEYLSSLGIERNVVLAPDPAFAVSPKRPPLPPEIKDMISGCFIGLNLSPLLAKYVTGNDLERWRDLAVSLVSGLLSEFDIPILLIPHVTSAVSDRRMDDKLFLDSVRVQLNPHGQTRVAVAAGGLSCEEIKWLISQADVFIGARTHSTLAALSTGVPCISIAYSQKAWGINEWIFGHNDWVLPSEGITPQGLVPRVAKLRQEKVLVRTLLQKTGLRMQQEAFTAARHVGTIVRARRH